MTRVLFVAEAVSLAHVARPYVLARSLLGDAGRFEVHFASAKRFPIAFHDGAVREWSINSIEPDQFRSALKRGAPIYDATTLSRYVAEDLKLLDAVNPDVVVGDFRLSLAVSAPARKVHYVAITNAHWSPYSVARTLPVPEHRLGAIVGTRIAQALFDLAQPMLLAHHAAGLNSVRRAYGLPAVGSLREAYTWADTTLYADVPELAPTDAARPASHRYIGPVIWSPEVPWPAWWNALPDDATCIYMTLGSTGQLRALPAVIEGLANVPATVLFATAEREADPDLPRNFRRAPFLPGADAVRKSALVVCNGGSATVYQALAGGKPVLALPSNVDQHLTTEAVTKAGAGLAVRAENATPGNVRSAVERLLAEAHFTAGARRVEGWFAAYEPSRRFAGVVREILGPEH